MTPEQPSMRWSTITASSPSHQPRSCGVCARADAPASNTPVKIEQRRFAATRGIGNSIIRGGQAKSCRTALSFLPQRVEGAHQALEALLEHMGIELCRGDVGVAESRLQHPQVRAVVQEMTREGVAEHVRAHLRSAQSRGGGERLEFAGKVLAREVAGFTERGEKPFCLPVTARTGQEREVLAHGLLGRFVERHETLLVAL